MLTVALDQNHWINLSAGFYRKNARYIEFAERALHCVEAGELLFLPFKTNLMELIKPANSCRRARLLDAFIEYSRLHVLVSPDVVLNAEIYNAIVATLGFPLEPLGIDGVGVGLAPALHSSLANRHEFRNVFDASESHSGVWRYLLTPEVLGRQATLAGFDRLAEGRAEMLERARQSLRSVTRDTHVLANIEPLIGQAMGVIRKILLQLGVDPSALAPEQWQEVVRRIPTFDVEVELATERDRQWDKPIDPNDMYDISLLTMAIPYTDAVATERFWNHHVHNLGLQRRYGTAVVADLLDLEPVLFM